MSRDKRASSKEKEAEGGEKKPQPVDKEQEDKTKASDQPESDSIKEDESKAASDSSQVAEGEVLPPEPEADKKLDGSELDWESDEEDSEESVSSLESQLQEALALVEENRGAYLRALAEMQNLRKRSERDSQQSRQFAIEGFARDLLSVADNLERALNAIPDACSPELKTLQDGVVMIKNELMRSFDKHGVKRIHALNTPFDPHLHQAVMQVETAEVKPGEVVQEMQSGYQLNGRLLRPAMVGVAVESKK